MRVVSFFIALQISALACKKVETHSPCGFLGAISRRDSLLFSKKDLHDTFHFSERRWNGVATMTLESGDRAFAQPSLYSKDTVLNRYFLSLHFDSPTSGFRTIWFSRIDLKKGCYEYPRDSLPIGFCDSRDECVPNYALKLSKREKSVFEVVEFDTVSQVLKARFSLVFEGKRDTLTVRHQFSEGALIARMLKMGSPVRISEPIKK